MPVEKMRVAVIGAGISGLVSASVLAKAGVEVVLYETKDSVNGLTKTVTLEGVHLDLINFMAFNQVTCLDMMEFFESLGVDMETSHMSFSVSLDKSHGYEWGSRNGLSSLFAQKKNMVNPYFWRMIREVIKFKDDAISYLEEVENNPDIDRSETLGQFIKSRGYSKIFQKAYLIPICRSIWSCSPEGVLSFSAISVLSFCLNHHLLELFGQPQWLTIRWHLHGYANKVMEQLKNWGCRIKKGSEVSTVSHRDAGWNVACGDGSEELYDGCIMAVHAPDALSMLGSHATFDERRILGAFQYVYSDIFLHRDESLMPQNPAAWSAWNFLGNSDEKVCLTYWLNVLQKLGETDLPFLVTVNPGRTPEHTLLKWTTGHPLPSVASHKASFELNHIQGKRAIWFCGADQGYGFHEDGLKAAMTAAHSVLGKTCAVLTNPRHMVPSLIETGARLFVVRFLRNYISTGSMVLQEEGGTTFTFEGTRKNCNLKTVLRIHNPHFYWNVMTQADLGLADSYINGDFSFVDKDNGLLNLFLVYIANRDLHSSTSKLRNNRGWWTPMLFTAGIASAKYYFRHISRQNTLTQARRNNGHYDLSNELFSLFLDETMAYSCALFKNEDEDLKVAQMRKILLLIEKARISKDHEILEIGCGWGTLGIEVVKRTGCKYTGITLSQDHLRYSEMKVKESGLQDHIKLYLCDYRQLPKSNKYDRIISVEMIEHVGHEYIREFFSCCDSLLAEDGLLILQFQSIPDQRYDENKLSSDFIKEYIFPGACLPCLSSITSSMASKSRLCVEHLENIGIHYSRTLRYWRKNFLENKSKIIDLGFNEKFIRTWEYYFDYLAAGHKSRTLGNYQGVGLVARRARNKGEVSGSILASIFGEGIALTSLHLNPEYPRACPPKVVEVWSGEPSGRLTAPKKKKSHVNILGVLLHKSTRAHR